MWDSVVVKASASGQTDLRFEPGPFQTFQNKNKTKTSRPNILMNMKKKLEKGKIAHGESKSSRSLTIRQAIVYLTNKTTCLQ